MAKIAIFNLNLSQNLDRVVLFRINININRVVLFRTDLD